jgi:branched-chain amino acid transport system permease protein
MLDNVSLLYLAPALNVQLLLDGLFIGAIFALAAYGLALVWGVMNLKNLAQGDFVIMGGYIAWWLGAQGVHPLFGLPVAAVVMFGFGWLVYQVVIARVVDKDLFTSLLATFGLAIVLQQALNLMFGPETQTANAGFETLFILDNQVTVTQIRIISLFLCLILALGLVWFMKTSRMGQAIRATAQDARAAKVMGIDTDAVYAFTFSLNAAICGVAGALVSMIWVIQPFFGITHSIRAFVIVTAAGLGNLPGVVLSGFGLGIAEQFGGFILGAEFQQAIVVGILIAVLIWRQIQMSRHRMVVQ